MKFIETTRVWARRIKRDVMTLWFARAHPATPWYAKLLGGLTVAYALSPIDLIPDFIPVLGYLDDVILLPALIWLTVKMLPPQVLCESRRSADEWLRRQAAKPRSLGGAVAIGAMWVTAALLTGWWAYAAWRA